MPFRLNFLSFRTRLLLLVALALLPALGLILYEGNRDRDEARRQAAREVTLSTQLASHSVSTSVALAETLLATIASTPEIRGGGTLACQDVLATLPPGETDIYIHVYVSEPDGSLRCSAEGKATPPADVAAMDSFARATQTRTPVLGDFRVDTNSGRAIAPFHYPLLRDGRVVAVLGVSFDLDRISRNDTVEGLPAGSVFYTVDRSGVVLTVAPFAEGVVGQPLPVPVLRERIIGQARAGTVELTGDDGERRLYGYGGIFVPGDARPYVVVGQPTSAIFASAQAALQRNLIGLAVVTVLALTFAWLIGNVLFLRRVRDLVGATRAVAAGALDVRVPVEGRDELTTLARSFNDMTGRLAASRDEMAQREAEFRDVFDAAQDGLVINDIDNRTIVEVNPAFAAMHGYTQQELIGASPLIFIHPGDHQKFRDYIDRVMGGGTYRTRARDIRKDGSEFVIEVTGSLFQFRGRPHALAVCRDVTEVVESERLLEDRVADRTRELTTLLAVTRSVGSTLELRPLITLVLERLRDVVDYTGASVLIFRGDVAEVIEASYSTGSPPGARSSAGLRLELANAGPLMEMFRRGEAVVVEDVRGDSVEAAAFRATVGPELQGAYSYARAFLAVPLMVRDEPVGILAMAREDPGAFDANQARLASVFAGQVAAALDNARLFEETRRRAEETAALARVAASFTLVHDVHSTIGQLARVVVEATEAIACDVVLLDDRLRVLDSADYGLPAGYQDAVRRAVAAGAPTPLDMAAASLKSTVIRNSRQRMQTAPGWSPVGEIVRDEAWDDVAVTPLVYRGRAIGAINTFYRAGETPGDDGLRFLRAMADQAAVGIESVRLFAQTERRARENAALAAIAGQVTLDQPMDRTLEAIAGSVAAAAGAPSVAVFLRQDGPQSFALISSYGIQHELSRLLVNVPIEPGSVRQKAMEEQRPQVVPDLRDRLRANSNYPRLRHIVDDMPWRTTIDVPIIIRGKSEGVMMVAYHETFEPDEALFDTLTNVAHQAAVAIENVFLYEQAERRARENAALAEIAASITLVQPLEQTMDTLSAAVVESTPAVAAAVILFDPATLQVHLTAGRGLPEGYLDAIRLSSLDPAWGPDVQRSLRHPDTAIHRYHLRAEVLADPRYAPIHGLVDQVPWASSVMLPLRYQGRTLGGLDVFFLPGQHPRAHEVDFLRAIADQAAVAVENARLFAEAGEQAREQEAIARIAATLTYDRPLGQVLEALAADVRAGTGVEAVSVLVMDATDGSIDHFGDGFPEGYLEAQAQAWRDDEAYWRSQVENVTDPIVFTDAPGLMRSHPSFRAMRPFADIITWNCVVRMPFATREMVRGFLVIYSKRPPDDRELRFYYAVADQIGVAVENAGLFKEVQRRAREQEALATIAGSLTFDQPVEGVLATLARDVVASTDAVGCTILIAEEGLALPVAIGTAGLPAGYVEAATGRLSRFPDYWDATNDDGGPRLTVGVRQLMRQDPAWAAVRHWADDIEFDVILRIPFTSRATGRGSVSFYFAGSPGGDRGMRFYQSVAGQIAIAVDNARLFWAVRQRTRELSALYRADEELHRSLVLDDVLRALLAMVVETMEADDAGLILWEPGTPRPRLINVTHSNERLIATVEDSLVAQGREAFDRLEAEGIGNVSACEDTAASADVPRDRTVDIGVRALLEVPIFLEGQLFALLDAVYTRPRRFTEEQRRLFGSLARRAALAIENARLYAQAQSLAAIEERQRLARELHDSVSQALYGIALGARTARTLLERDPAKAKDPVDYVLALAEAGLAEMRALIFELRPESLANEGIVAAIEKQVASTRARYGVDVVTDLPGEPDVSLPVKEAIYRVAQEALHNVVKHARATRVELRLAAEDGHLALDLKDDGQGFDPEGDFPGHLGLRSMRERVARLGGDFAVESAPGAGTRVRARVPC